MRRPLGQEHLFITFRQGASWEAPSQIRYHGDDWPSDSGNGDGEPQISPDGATLYFDSSRSAPVDLNRTRAQFLSDASRLDIWDNGNSNVWTLPLRPLLDALRRRQKAN
jgi:hypothetical protein